MKQVSDEEIIREAVRLVNEGLAVTLKVKGRSMLPFILGGVESAVLTRPENLRVGDVVLARIDGRRYVLHRIQELSDERAVLMGDGNIAGSETCRPQDILARVDEVVGADGKHRRLDTPRARRRARLWRRLKPVRRWILAIYKRTILRNIDIQ